MRSRDIQFDENVLLVLNKANINCLNCHYWEQKSNFENVQNYGSCYGLCSGDIYVDIQIEGNAIISGISTDEDFFCANFKRRVGG